MARTPVERPISRRVFLKSTALVAVAAATTGATTMSGCNVVPGLGSKEKMSVWTDATFAPASDDYQTKVIKDWAQQNNVEVEITRDPGGDVQTKLQAALESKQLPDISQVDSGRYTLFQRTGTLLDVSDLYAELGQQWGGFYKSAAEIVTVEGKQYAMPYSIDSSLILYRNDVLQKHGINGFPGTWKEVVEKLKPAQDPPNLYLAGVQFNKAGTDSENTFAMWALGHGAALQAEDSKTLTIKTPEMMTFLNELKWSWDQGIYPPGVTGWDNAGNNTALQDGKVIFIHNPASPLVWFRENKPDMLPNIGVASTPGGPKGKFNQAYMRDGFAIMNSGDQKRTDRSKDLLRRLYSKEVYRQWIGLAFPAPAVSGMEDHEVWSNPQRKGFLEAAKTGVRGGYPGHDTPASAELGTRTPWLTMATRMVVDGWTPTQAMEELDQIARDVYSKYFK
jgi:ABC-type glycerol-3-phosphate transport system substrate-binding protein